MSLLDLLVSSAPPNRFAVRPEKGWIGIDIGSRAIKLAQLERQGSDCHIAARWTLSDESQTSLSRDEICSAQMGQRLAQIKSLRRIFTGRNCSAVLPMSLVEFRILEIPRGSATEQQRMTGEELSADLGMEPADLAFDCWETGSAGFADSGLTRMAVIAVPKPVAEHLANHLLSAGMECQALNGMPCVLARAVELTDAKQVDEAVVALDLGYTSPLLVLVKGGQPIFSRILRGVGLNSIMQPLESSLHLSPAECQQLLVQYGVTAVGQAPILATQKTMPLMASPLYNLVSEIQRTLEYIGQQFRALKPQRVCLFGGGALVKNLPEYLSQKLQLPATPWKLGGVGSDPSDALYGVAAGLSSLVWENSPCL